MHSKDYMLESRTGCAEYNRVVSRTIELYRRCFQEKESGKLSQKHKAEIERHHLQPFTSAHD